MYYRKYYSYIILVDPSGRPTIVLRTSVASYPLTIDRNLDLFFFCGLTNFKIGKYVFEY